MLVATAGTEDGPTERRTVITGTTVGNEIEITSGLTAGEQVLVEITLPAGATRRWDRDAARAASPAAIAPVRAAASPAAGRTR